MATPLSVPNDFVMGNNSDPDAVDANYAAIVTWINANAVHRDGATAFTGAVSGPNEDPTTANQFARKSYLDTMFNNAVPQTTLKEVKLRRVANQSITAAATTAVSWDTEDADVAGFIAVTGSTLTVPSGAAGLYAIGFDAVSASSVSYNLIPRINGVNYTTGYARLDGSAGATAKISMVAYLAVGTTLQFMINNTGATNNFTATLWMNRLND